MIIMIPIEILSTILYFINFQNFNKLHGILENFHKKAISNLAEIAPA